MNLKARNSAYTTTRTDVVALVPTSAQQILDVGCSDGTLGRYLISLKPDRKVDGIEFDNHFAAKASSYLNHVINADLNLLKWDETLDNKQFDCIVFSDVLEHLIDPHCCLMQARKHLVDGGSIVVSLPNIRHISAFFEIFLSGRFPQRDRGIFDRTHLRWFTINDAHKLLADCGFKVTAVNHTLRWHDRGGGSMNKLLNRLPQSLKMWSPVREFLTYQHCLRAEVAE